MASSEERRDEPAKEMVHKTKVIQFLGRTTPIILQNDNGPCPLLAICNVLLLKNNLNLSPDIAEVTQEKLLSLVAERLIDSNSNANNKDAGYVENQQQNISDAIDLLPRLTTGIDVNIKFKRIDDFEFTPECAIFDLLDIPLYHGWIVDPQLIPRYVFFGLKSYKLKQMLIADYNKFSFPIPSTVNYLSRTWLKDYDTMDAIGSMSYNTLMGELVSLETRNMEDEHKKNSEEGCIDFAAATTATLGVPSPCLSRGRSFDDSPRSGSDDLKVKKGDFEEEVELLRVLKLSGAELPASVDDTIAVNTNLQNLDTSPKESAYLKKSEPTILVETIEAHDNGESQTSHQEELCMSDKCNALSNYNNDLMTSDTVPGEVVSSFSQTSLGNQNDQSSSEKSGEHVICKDIVEKISVDVLVQNKNASFNSPGLHPASTCENQIHNSGGNELVENLSTSSADIHRAEHNPSGCDTTEFSSLSLPNADSDSSSGRRQLTEIPEAFSSSVDGSEPIYEGEECILDSGKTIYEDREPMYEGEVILAEQVVRRTRDAYDASPKNEITPKHGELIRNFLKNNAIQLTIYGLFLLQDGLKERELCVFFRNNHFNTMFKFEGELYILATDQGYINQPDLVWEKLNEVNGNTLFMTGNFKEFKVENHANSTWDEQNAMNTTADYLASIDNSVQVDSSFNSDLQLAIALQQQEFEQQPHRSLQQPTISGLVTGPQVSRNNVKNSSSSPRQDAKSKDKCTVM